jgi:hypothetical protein
MEGMARELIPIAVRIATRNAIGGWGPYTMREIDDLFKSFGFVNRDDRVADAGGQRRTLVEAYQARIDFTSPEHAERYLQVIGEVLEQYPKDSSDAVGQKLWRELRRAGIVAGPTDRLAIPAMEVHTAQSENATRGLWNSDRIRVFVSHTSARRAEVGELARALDRFAFSCFVAHDRIEPSREWQEVIESALRTCDVLLAYVTPDFSQSHWTDQEVGWALGRELVVLPISVDATPYGFFGAYQALAIRQGQLVPAIATSIAQAIGLAIFGRQRPGAERLLDRLAELFVKAVCESPAWESTRQRYPLLELIPSASWTEDHLARLEKAAIENREIRECVLQVPRQRKAPEAVAELVAHVRASRH